MERRTLVPLLLLVLVAAALRLHALDGEPWLDEVTTYLRDRNRSLSEIVTRYDSQNQHVLYSALAHLSIASFGDSVASLRAPAVVFGVLSVVALYLFSRAVVPPAEALLASAVLAFSYHGVWFSQNARGYTMLLCWTLLSSLLLLRAAAGERRRTWIAYACVVALGAWTHLTMLFVAAGHLLVHARLRRRAQPVGAPRGHGLVWGFALALLLVIVVYAPVLPSVLAVNGSEGLAARVPRWKSSGWALGELATALRGAFAAAGLALVAAVVGALGVVRFARERPEVVELAAYPVAVAAAVVIGSEHDLWPRFFFFALGFAALLLVAGAMEVGRLAASVAPPLRGRGRAVGATLVLLIVALEAATVSRAWGPKQRYRDALALVARERRPGDAVLVIGTGHRVFVDFYRADWRVVASLGEVRDASARARRTWLVHSFPVAMAARHGDVERELRAGFDLVGRFAGTLNGGDVLVWRTAAEDGRHARSVDR
ncbi:MAG: glycosyltransferase family 39 protein [Thermodesulfobacteriota bacterium]